MAEGPQLVVGELVPLLVLWYRPEKGTGTCWGACLSPEEVGTGIRLRAGLGMAVMGGPQPQCKV